MMVAQHLHALRQDQVLIEKNPSLAPQISALPSRTGTRIVSTQAPRDQTRDPAASSTSSSISSSALSDQPSQDLITTVLHRDVIEGVKTGNDFVDDSDDYDDDYDEEEGEDEGVVTGEDSELDDSDYDSDEQVDDDNNRDHTETAPALQKVLPVRQSSTQALHGHNVNNNNNNKNSLADSIVQQLQQKQQQKQHSQFQHHLLPPPPPRPPQPRLQRRQQHYQQQEQQSTLFFQDSNGGSLQEQAERRNSAQKAQQELVMQLTIAANAWAKDGSNHVASFTSIHSGIESSSGSTSNNNDNSTCTTSVDNREGELVAAVANFSSSSGDQDATSRGRLLILEEDQSESDKDDNGERQSGAGVPPRPGSQFTTHTATRGTRPLEEQAQDQLAERQHSSSSSTELLPLAPHVAKARMVPYVEEEDEDEDEYDEGSVEDEEEDTQEGEDDYSYSEDDEEEDDDDEEDDEDESLNEYHYGAKQDPRLRGSRTSGRQGQYHRSMYGYRPTRLDEHFLQKRAITKQVVRRSSLTALLGEVSQPDQQMSQLGFHTTGPAFGQQEHANGAVRRPALVSVWPDANATDSRSSSGTGPFDNRTITEDDARSSQSTSTDAYRRSPLGLQGPAMPKIANTQEPNRPRRTDSGVEVKLSPNADRDSATNSDSTMDHQRRRRFGEITIQLPSDSSPVGDANPATLSSLGALSVRRFRVKSDGDLPAEGSLPLESSAAAASSSSSSVFLEGSGSKAAPAVKYPLRSSISCQTFPRASGKRNGRKHVSWHYSLFPTEPVLKIKPSLPSLSGVAATSAEAELSKLPTIPVMARDNVQSFHQSIRSLRTLSRDEITKMSYKQQGRQQLSSPVPISKSVNDSIPWWSPSRWFKASVTIDKRHWKPDDSRESCAFCFSPFHRITNPRHHCRKCGDIFCGKCASAEILMDAKNCVYVQQSQLPRWSRRVDIQRHSLWIDTLPQFHPVRTAVETGLVAGPIGTGGADSLAGQAGLNGAGGVNGYLGGVSMGHRSGSGSGSGNGRRGSWQMAPGATKKSRVSIFGLFGGAANGAPGVGNNPPFAGSDSRRGSMDTSGNEHGLPHHHHHSSFLLHQPHSSNPLAVSFASVGRRSSSSSILRTGSVNGGSHHLLMTNGSNGSGEGGGLLTPPITMSRRMSSGGVGEVCLARICVGCERELLKPVPRCTSIAKYYGSIGARNGYRPPHGYSSLGPHAGAGMASYGGGRGNGGRYEAHQHQQQQQQQQGGRPQYSPAEDIDPTLTSDHHHHQQQQQHQYQAQQHNHHTLHHQPQQHTNGVRRHSPLGQTSYVAHHINGADLFSHQQQQQQQQHHQQQQQQHNGHGYGYGTEEAVGPYGETRSNPAVLTFQEEQMRYTQQACGPMYRELS